MKKNLGLATMVLTVLFTFSSITYANSATPLLNKSCPKLKAIKTSAGKSFTCSIKSGKRVWLLTPKSNLKQALTVPPFTLVYNSTGSAKKTPAVLVGIYGVPEKLIKSEALTGFNVTARADDEWSSPEFITITKSDLVVQGQKVWVSHFEIGPKTLGKDISVKVQAVASGRTSKWSEPQIVSTLVSTPTSSSTPTPSPTSSSTPTPSPTTNPQTTPGPVTSASPTAEVGCSVNYSSALPYASQRISILSMNWEKDSSGYVFANATMRNDNSMALRLVNFSFYIFHKGSLVFTTSTLEGNHHFFIQGDAQYNSTDGTSGPWMPGQVRTFKMPTNQILECRSISVSSSGYTVKQGIGAN
jgi:hypothetical protein